MGARYGTLSRLDATRVDPGSGAGATLPACVADGVTPGYTQTNSQISAVTSGNAELQPETSNSLMLGAVWSPSFAAQAAWSARLDIGVTFYRHTIENAIQAPDAQATLERCVFLAAPAAGPAQVRLDRGHRPTHNE